MEDEAYVTMREAQAILGVSNRTIWRMVKEGRLRAYPSRVDRRRKLIRRADLEELRRPAPPEGERRGPAKCDG